MSSPGSRSRWRPILRVSIAPPLAGITLYVLALLPRFFAGPYQLPRHRIESPLFILAAGAALFLWLLDPGENATAPAETYSSRLIRFVLAVLGSYALYWPALSVGLLSDDYVLRRWATTHEFVGASHEFVRPLPLLLWNALFTAMGGARALHATLLLLHGVNAFFVGELAIDLGLGGTGAAVASALFLAWPTQVEPVVWAAGSFDVIAASGCLAAVLFIVRSRSNVQILGAAFACVAALLSKETALALPFLIVILLLVPRRSAALSPSQRAAAIAVASISIVYGLWRVLIRPPATAAPLSVLSRYAAKNLVSGTFGGLAVPFPADTIARAPWLALLFASLPLVVAIGLLVISRRRTVHQEAAASGLLWALATAAPATGLLLIDSRLAGSRYLYLPSAGWSIFLAALFVSVARRSRSMCAAALLLAVIVVGVAGWQGRTVLRDWQDAARLRDELVTEAAAAVARGSCATAAFKGLPAMSGGAQVFRNGFDEAFAEQAVHPAGEQRCTFRWNGRSFVVE